MSYLKISNLSKTFDNNTNVLSNVDLDIKKDEFMVLVGPSGCGKSTLLRIIAGLEFSTNGEITLGEKLLNPLPPKNRDVAMVFQNYALYPHMTVQKNLSFGLSHRNFSKNEICSKISETAKMLDITSLLDRMPKTLSGGQKQRVAIGRAIIRHPKVFLFDEPLSNLDAKLRIEMRREILSLHKKLKTTTVYVTHDQVEAMSLGTRICVMKNGIIQQVGSPMEVYKDPSNMFVASFIGTPPMNFIDGKITSDNFFISNSNNIKIPLNKHYNPSNVILGIRPKYVLESKDGFKMKIITKEILGERSIIHSESNGDKISFESETSNDFSEGNEVKLTFSSNNCYLFDAKTHNRIY